MKVAPTGVRLWSTTFDALTANNEIPAFVALDPFDNVYVTGAGGPAYVLANGSSYMRMVTLKYTANGDPVWTISSVDGGLGNAVRVGSDGSTLFVQGYGQMYTARYRQTGLAGDVPPPVVPPPAPTNLAASSSTRARIDLTWINTANSATSITVQRCSGSTCSAFVAVAQLAATAKSWIDSGVKSRSTYRYRVFASNDAGSSAYSSIASAKAR
jgi:hypothetical protein